MLDIQKIMPMPGGTYGKYVAEGFLTDKKYDNQIRLSVSFD